MRIAALTLASILAVTAAPARAQQAPESADGAAAEAPPAAPEGAGERAPWPGEPEEPPIYATWWFWTAIAAVAIGITAAIVVGVTTEAPASAARSPLRITF